MRTRKRRTLRFLAGLTAVLALAAIFAAVAGAWDSGDKAPGTGPQALTWTGNGWPADQTCTPDNTGTVGYQNGASPGNYMLWILNTDGGSITGGWSLTINKTTYTTNDDHQLVTPYVDPTGPDGAVANLNVAATGGGGWVLTLSHGCGSLTPPADDLTVTKTALPSFTRDYDWSMLKSQTTSDTPIDTSASSTDVDYQVEAAWTGPVDSDWQVAGTITVSNPNAFDVAGVDVTDAIDNGGVCSVTNGTNQTISANSSITRDYSCTYASAPDPAAGTNTATATWDQATYDTPSGSATGTAGVDFSEVTPTVTHDTTTVEDTFNGGTTDTLGIASIDGTFVKDAGNTLDNWDESYATQSQTFTFTYSRTVDVTAGTCTTYDNTATVSDDATLGDNSSDASVTVCGGADLTVSKTLDASFQRDYDWSVLKSQTTSTTPIETSASSTDVDYEVQAAWTGPVDSGWTVSGTITVTNPNDWESVTLTDVSDAIDNGGDCSITSGNVTGTIAAEDSATFEYECTYASAPDPAAGTNTATATWDKAAASTPNGSADGTAGVDFSTVTPTVTHDTTTVKDTFNGGTPLTLGVAGIDGTFVKDAGNTLANWTNAYNSGTKTFTFTYSRTVTVVPNTCIEYDNTATVSDDATPTDNSSDASVIVCGQITGGKTIGFWSNKNGKAVLCAHDPGWRTILNGTAAGAPYNTGSYLRNANGTLYTVSTSGNCATAHSSFSSWLLSATATNMSYMLSAQLAGTILDVNYNGMNANVCIAGVDGNPITLNGLITGAIDFLQHNGDTTAAGTARTTATDYKNIFDKLNNGLGYAVPGCP